jgi:drug/metabolite transporter (DMT)-like permease
MPYRSVVMLMALAALWGGSFVFIRYTVPAMGAVPLAFARVTLAAMTLGVFAVAQRRTGAHAARWRSLAVVGAVNSALPFVLFSYAEQTITASTAAILNATSPIFGALAAAIWLGEFLTRRKIGGMLLGLVGVALLVGLQPEPPSSDALLAVLACLCAAMCYALGGVYTKRRLKNVPSFTLALGSQLSAAIVLAPLLPFAPMPGPVTPLMIVNVVALAVASTALAYLLYFRLIADIGPSRALTVTFLIPLFGAVWAWLFLGEAITANMLAGGAMIVAGTALALNAR